MSAWVLVKCKCPNRHPLGESLWGDYACGHRDGAVISTSPYHLITYGADLERIYKHQPEMFEMWRKIRKWRSYSHRNNDLHLQPGEVLMWQLEIEQLQRFLSGEEFMGWDEIQLWRKLREEERLSYARANDEPRNVQEVLAEGLALCRASQKTGNPIEFS
jgi:hypothetical protein